MPFWGTIKQFNNIWGTIKQFNNIVAKNNNNSFGEVIKQFNNIAKNTKSLIKEDISQYLETYNETLNNCKEKISSVKNYSDDNSLKDECSLLENKIQEQLKNAETDLSKDIKKALDNLNDIVAETNKLYSEASNIKEKMDSIYLNKYILSIFKQMKVLC